MSETSTQPSVQDVDAAVRSVLAELYSPARFGARNGSREQSVYAGRLLSLKSAEALPAGLRELKIAPGTVVTPLARDFLKRVGVVLNLVSRAEADRERNLGEWGFATETKSGLIDAFRRSLHDGNDEWRDLGESLDVAADWVAGAGQRGALLLTDESSLAVYRACQVAGVRAASAEDATAAAKAVRAIGVNFLVVETAGKPIALLKQMSATFRRAGGPVAPDWIGHLRGGRP